jgi:hypothetical protein
MSLFGSSALLANGGGQQPVIDNFTGSGVWYCCPGAKTIQVITIAGGGGGGGTCNRPIAGCGCPTFGLSGGGGGQGGGISMCCFSGTQVGASGPVVVGAGGAGSVTAANGCAGANSVWCSGSVNVSAMGGGPGQGSGNVNNGCVGSLYIGCGIGNYRCGNGGGGSRYNGNGADARNDNTNSTRGGGGGGGAYYCNVIPISCTFWTTSNASTASFFCSPQTCIDLTSIGAGGRGGITSFDNSSFSCNGVSGNGGYVRVIQYF